MIETTLLDLVDSIYEAAVEPEKYKDFLAMLSRAVDSRMSMLMTHDTESRRASIALSVGVDDALQKRYSECAAVDPFLARGRAYMQAGSVVTGNMLLADEELVRTEFYREQMQPFDLHHVIGGTVTNDEFAAALFTSVRSKRQGPFEAPEIELFRSLIPHLRRSLEVQKRLAAQDGQRAALDRIPNGCILLGKSGKVLAMNRAADQMLAARDGLTYSSGRLDASAPECSSQLREQIYAATSSLHPSNASSLTVVARPSGKRPYTVFVAPFSRKSLDWSGVLPIAAVFVSDPSSNPVTEASLAQLYRFTPAEARLARALANGEGLGQAAEKIEVGINTAKTHLQRIFSKTQTSRQAELVRLFASIAALTASHAAQDAHPAPGTQATPDAETAFHLHARRGKS